MFSSVIFSLLIIKKLISFAPPLLRPLSSPGGIRNAPHRQTHCDVKNWQRCQRTELPSKNILSPADFAEGKRKKSKLPWNKTATTNPLANSHPRSAPFRI